MEKLQVAIEHARNRRDSASIRTVTPDAPVQTPAEEQSDVWAGLKRFEPKPKHLARARIITANDATGAKTAIDMLRTRLLKMLRENGWTRIMVTSPSPGCGKSTLVANLAMALQRQNDLKTMLIDLDLQQAELGAKLGLLPEKGVADFLSGEVSVTEQFYRIGDNLAVSASRKKRGFSRELLKTSSAQGRIDEAEALLAPDVVLIDLPPMFASDDTIVAAGFADCAIIVGAAEQTTIAELGEVERDLAQYTNIAGVVLNKNRFPPKQYSYGYNYR